MKILAIAFAGVRMMLRERSNVFFVFIFPLALILLIGAQFGGGVDPRIGIFLESPDDDLANRIVADLEGDDRIEVVVFDERRRLDVAVERGFVQAGAALPDAGALAEAGLPVDVEVAARPDGIGPQMEAVITSAVARVMVPVSAAQFTVEQTGYPYREALDLAHRQDNRPAITIEASTTGEALFPSTLGRFDLGASQQLVLFVFLTALAGSARLIQSRQLGVSRRMMSTPTSIRTIIVGEGAARFAVALTQGVYIVAATLIMFRVNWGDPLGAIALLIALAAVGAGAAMLMGSVFSNDQQAGGIAVVAALGLAALGGSMLPSELFSPTMQTVAHVTPHAWALDGFAELVRRDGGLLDILPELGVLFGYAAVLVLFASYRLRVAITRP